ncbi:MAG: hypothetical protein M1832_000091 [Thelocarpon impressellum]|nr:MAG: hypothetical protein M1832_000091 [Thelocarpon impressellum]
MALLRRRPVCFYCGRRSASRLYGDVRQWRCETCEAVNHLDENGDITDPPASSTAPSAQYAVWAPETAEGSVSDDSLFCPTCIKNQHLLTQSLASYFPPPDDPDYATYEASYPAYRESLEDRYPQVCVDCEPRVRERIRAAGYVAKTDHLRRMMERSRRPGSGRGGGVWGWREAVVVLGSLAWWWSLLSQMSWNLLGAVASAPTGLAIDGSTMFLECLSRCVLRREVEADCAVEAHDVALTGLLLGVAGVWWNNRLMEKVRGSGGRMVGLSEFYKLQAVALVTRVLAWYLLREGSLELGPEARKGAHSFMLAFNVLTTLISIRTVKIDHNPRVSFHHEVKPLKAGPAASRQDAYITPPASQAQPFPIHRLGAPSPRPSHSFSDPPTPPPEDLDAASDAMDWTPTQAAFAINYRGQPVVQPAGPAFSTYARLPPAPRSQAAKLRNPPSNVPFFKTASPDEKQAGFFHKLIVQPGPPQHSAEQVAEDSMRSHAELAPPRFFPPADTRADTGLEGLFDAAFSLKDAPSEVLTAQQQQRREKKSWRGGARVQTAYPPTGSSSSSGSGASVSSSRSMVEVFAVCMLAIVVLAATLGYVYGLGFFGQVFRGLGVGRPVRIGQLGCKGVRHVERRSSIYREEAGA